MNPVTIVIVEDHVFFRKTLRRFLQGQPIVEVVGEAGDGLQAIELVARLQPAVVILDIQMPGLDGVAACQTIKWLRPETRVILYSAASRFPPVGPACRAGLRSFEVRLGKPDLQAETHRLRYTARTIWSCTAPRLPAPTPAWPSRPCSNSSCLRSGRLPAGDLAATSHRASNQCVGPG